MSINCIEFMGIRCEHMNISISLRAQVFEYEYKYEYNSKIFRWNEIITGSQKNVFFLWSITKLDGDDAVYGLNL